MEKGEIKTGSTRVKVNVAVLFGDTAPATFPVITNPSGNHPPRLNRLFGQYPYGVIGLYRFCKAPAAVVNGTLTPPITSGPTGVMLAYLSITFWGISRLRTSRTSATSKVILELLNVTAHDKSIE